MASARQRRGALRASLGLRSSHPQKTTNSPKNLLTEPTKEAIRWSPFAPPYWETFTPPLTGELETGLSADARGQSTLCAETEIRGDDRFQPWEESLPEPRAADAADRCRSTLAGRHHLHQTSRRVRVPGCRSGRLLASRDRLGTGPDT
jgi:hypothetical protein